MRSAVHLTTLLLVVVMLCLETMDAHRLWGRPRGRGGSHRGRGGNHRGRIGNGRKWNGHSKPERKHNSVNNWGKGYERACEVTIGGVTVLSRTCGCGTEDGGECTILAPDRKIGEEMETRKFCDFTTDSGDSVMLQLRRACYLTDTENNPVEGYTPCPTDQHCPSSDDSINITQAWQGFQKDGKDVLAYFCSKSKSENLPRCDRKWSKWLCNVTVNGETESSQTCSDDFSCDLTSPVRLNEQGKLVQRTYCYKEPDVVEGDEPGVEGDEPGVEGDAETPEFEGALSQACAIISTDSTDPVVPKECGTDHVCQTGDLNAWTGFTYRGDENAQAFFCTSECVPKPPEPPKPKPYYGFPNGPRSRLWPRPEFNGPQNRRYGRRH